MSSQLDRLETGALPFLKRLGHASVRRWRRDLRNTPAKTCPAAFPFRVLYSGRNPGIVMPVALTIASEHVAWSRFFRLRRPSVPAQE